MGLFTQQVLHKVKTTDSLENKQITSVENNSLTFLGTLTHLRMASWGALFFKLYIALTTVRIHLFGVSDTRSYVSFTKIKHTFLTAAFRKSFQWQLEGHEHCTAPTR